MFFTYETAVESRPEPSRVERDRRCRAEVKRDIGSSCASVQRKSTVNNQGGCFLSTAYMRYRTYIFTFANALVTMSHSR